VTVLIDPPRWPAHGRLWSHLVSDRSLEELHAFARRTGVPARGFEGDHYDVPEERYAALVDAGAVPVPGRELLRRLVASGLRLPKRRGERVLASYAGVPELESAGEHRLDVVASPLPTPEPSTSGGWVVATDAAGRLLLVAQPQGWDLPGGAREDGEGPAAAAVRRLAASTGLRADAAALRACGHLRIRLLGQPPADYPHSAPWAYLALFTVPLHGEGPWFPPEVARSLWWPVAEHVLGVGKTARP
jgi:8-oxo-dGTP pyrophosphatase MutT (NUDIX family)